MQSKSSNLTVLFVGLFMIAGSSHILTMAPWWSNHWSHKARQRAAKWNGDEHLAFEFHQARNLTKERLQILENRISALENSLPNLATIAALVKPSAGILPQDRKEPARKSRDSIGSVDQQQHHKKRKSNSVQHHVIDDSRVLYAVVTVNSNGSTVDRRFHNVRIMQNLWPRLAIFTGSYLLDTSCVAVLRQMGVKVSANYTTTERGVGWIHTGKIGHWCSFLRFLLHCNQSSAPVCVWIEDDVRLNQHHIARIRDEARGILAGPAKYPIVSLGIGDQVNVIDTRFLASLLRRFSRPFEILKPLDSTLRGANITNHKKVFNQNDFLGIGAKTSSIVCATCPIQTVASVNELLGF